MNYLDVPEGKLRISWYTQATDCLGPGMRFALWVQGCFQRCKNCIAQPLQDVTGGTLKSIEELAGEIADSDIEGITISGGEPFLQAQGLAQLLKMVKQKRPELGVITFTGYLYESLKDEEKAVKFLSYIDVLVDGSYVDELDDNAPMRGSSNQRIMFLTNRYSPDDLPQERKNRMIFDAEGFMMIGIPSQSAKILMKTFMSERDNNDT